MTRYLPLALNLTGALLLLASAVGLIACAFATDTRLGFAALAGAAGFLGYQLATYAPHEQVI